MKSLAIIIPVRSGDDPYTTLHSLGRSTYQDFTITIVQDAHGNANKARNEGFRLAPESEFVLFSDADIEWEPDGIGAMMRQIERHPILGFCYGSYDMAGKIQCDQPFSVEALRRRNLASTMSVIRRANFPGFDESIERLQDYDLFLSMAAAGHWGVHCGSLIFRTARRDGITQGGKVSYAEAFEVLRKKHSL